MKANVSSSSIVIVGLAVSVVAMIFGISHLGYLPFKITSTVAQAFFLLILAGFLASEIFIEEKIRNLRELQKKPGSLVETLIMGLTVAVALTLLFVPEVPEAMENLVGMLFVILSVLIAIEVKFE